MKFDCRLLNTHEYFCVQLQISDGLQTYLVTIERMFKQIRSLISQAALILCSSAFISNDTALSQMKESAMCANEGKLVSAVSEIQVFCFKFAT